MSSRNGGARLVARFVVPLLAASLALATISCGNAQDARSPSAASVAEAEGDKATVAAGVQQLVELLRDGGQVMYLRHAATDTSVDEGVPSDFSDCSTQRNLATAGRRQAVLLGEAVRQLALPVGDVLASPYCRTMDTARLAFGRARMDPRLLQATADGAGRRRLDALRELLASPPTHANRMLVGHAANIEQVAGVLLDEGEAAVFTPTSGGRFRLRGRIGAHAWARLARQ